MEEDLETVATLMPRVAARDPDVLRTERGIGAPTAGITDDAYQDGLVRPGGAIGYGELALERATPGRHQRLQSVDEATVAALSITPEVRSVDRRSELQHRGEHRLEPHPGHRRVIRHGRQGVVDGHEILIEEQVALAGPGRVVRHGLVPDRLLRRVEAIERLGVDPFHPGHTLLGLAEQAVLIEVVM